MKNQKIIYLATVLLGICLLLFPTSRISAKSVYVSKTGSDNSTGTLESPFASIQKGIEALSPGDTLYIGAGTYEENLTIPKSLSGKKNKRITLSNLDGQEVIICGAKGTSLPLLTIDKACHLKICGLEFANSSGEDACGIYVAGGSKDIVIKGNYIHDISTGDSASDQACANGILLLGDSKKAIDGVKLEGNTISNCDTGWAEAVSITGNCTNITVKDNTVSDITNIGIDFSGNYGYCPVASLDFPRKCKACGNKVSNCISPYATSYGIYVDGGQNITIQKNTVTGCSGGIEVGAEQKPKKEKYSTSKITISANTIKDNIENGITVGGYDKKLGWVKDTIIKNNQVINNGSGNAILTLSKCDGVTIKNNKFYNEDSDTAIVYWPMSAKYTKNISFSKNKYGGKGNYFVCKGKTYTKFTKWQKKVSDYKSKLIG